MATYCETRVRSTGRSFGTSNARARCVARSAALSRPSTGITPPSRQSLHDLAFLVLGDLHGVGSCETCLVSEDLRLHTPELGARLDSELLNESGARVLIDVEGLDLTTRAVEGEHQLTAKGFAERMLRDERFELADDVTVPAEIEVCIDPRLERHEAELVETPDLRLREVVERELGQRRATPKREGVLQ